MKIYTALTSSFNSDGTIHKEAIKSFINFNVNVSKVDGLYVNGSTGEFPMLTLEMKKAFLKVVKELTSSNIDLIAQIGSTSIFETIELGKYAISLGYEKISCITPFYFKHNFNELYTYYKKIAQQLKVDFYPYYIPALTGTIFTSKEIKEILNIPYVKGIKFSSQNVQLLHQVRYENPNSEIYWGWDEMMISGLVANVDGFIGSTYSLIGLNARKLIKAWNEKNLSKSRQLNINNIEIINQMCSIGLFEMIKYSIGHYYKIDVGVNILPTKKLTLKDKKDSETLMRKIGHIK